MKYIKKFESIAKNTDEIDYSNKGLTSLPELPDGLKKLKCSGNKLTSLPNLPDTLELLYCYNNQLTSLPELPDTLEVLYCNNNQLPYKNLEEYREWFANTYPEIIASKKFNI